MTISRVSTNEFTIRKDYTTATSGALALSSKAIKASKIVSVSCKFNTAPSTSENFTVTLDTNAGATYDVLLYSMNPSTDSTTDIFWMPDNDIYLETGDEIDVAFANTDNRTYGVQITLLEYM